MSYQAQSGAWDFLMGGSGVTDVVYDSRKGVQDFHKLNQIIRNELYSKLGYYKNPDGSPMYGENRMIYPVMTVADGDALIEYWIKIVNTASGWLASQMIRPSTTSINVGDYIDKLDALVVKFRARRSAWKQTAYATATEYQGRAMGLKSTALLLDTTIGNLVIELDNMTWTGFNIESPAGRIAWAIGTSAKDVVVGMTKGVASAVDAAGGIMRFGFDITKWAIVAGLAIGGVWLINQMNKRG